MKRIVLVALAALLLVPVIGCSSSNTSGLSGEVMDMMKMVSPDINMFSFMDIAAIRADDDLEDLYSDLEYSLGIRLISFGMCLCEVNNIAFVYEAYLSKGVFDLDETRTLLESFHFDEGEYEGIEVWEKEDSCIALIDSYFVISGSKDDVQYCIRIIEDGGESLYDDSDVKDVMDRLPNGISVGFVKERFIEDYTYDRLKVSGFSAGKKDKETLTYTFVLKFEDEKDVEGVMQDIEDDLGESEDNYQNIQMTQDGEYVKVSAERDMEDFILED